MKALLLLFVTLTFVPFAFSSRHLPPSSSYSYSSSESSSVLDIEGKELQLGLPYNALSNVFIFQPGLCLIDIKNRTTGCSHDVVQCSIFSKSIQGWPIIFNTPANVTAGNVIKEGVSYTVRFPVSAAGLLCIQEIFWGLADVNIFRKYITTDPTAGVLFQVQKEWSGYKIAYCVTIPVPRTPVCYPVGLIEENGCNRLGIGLGVNPLQFSFSKYNGTTLHAHATS